MQPLRSKGGGLFIRLCFSLVYEVLYCKVLLVKMHWELFVVYYVLDVILVLGDKVNPHFVLFIYLCLFLQTEHDVTAFCEI